MRRSAPERHQRPVFANTSTTRLIAESGEVYGDRQADKPVGKILGYRQNASRKIGIAGLLVNTAAIPVTMVNPGGGELSYSSSSPPQPL